MTYFNSDSGDGSMDSPSGSLKSGYNRKCFHNQGGTSEEGTG